jgi:hypothetical protein
MRILVTIPHYFRPRAGKDAALRIGSALDPLARIDALNQMIVALHSHFGRRRHGMASAKPLPGDKPTRDKLDIVILTVAGHNILDWVGLAKKSYEVRYLKISPWLLAHQAQRILRERAGGYDFYGYMEDDLIIHDPAFFEKLAWFQAEFGPERLLRPLRYEVTRRGTPAKVALTYDLPKRLLRPFRRPGMRELLVAKWHGRDQSFELATNPHAGAYFVSDEQLRRWIAHRSFNRRDKSWLGPMESAGALSVGKVFDLYQSAAPNPWFLEVEHYGARYAARAAPARVVYGESPLLAFAQRALREKGGEKVVGAKLAKVIEQTPTINEMAVEAGRLRYEYDKLRTSRSRLARAFLRIFFRRRSS